MAGDDDRDRVTIVRHPDGAEGVRLADRACDIGVGTSLAVGNRQERTPAGKLEIRASKIERESELAAQAGKVFLEFTQVRAQRFLRLLERNLLLLLAQVAGVGTNRLLARNPCINSRATNPRSEAARNNAPTVESSVVE